MFKIKLIIDVITHHVFNRESEIILAASFFLYFILLKEGEKKQAQ